MEKMLIAVFENERLAYEGLQALRELHREGTVSVFADAVIAKDAGGKVSIRQGPDEGPVGTVLGLLTGGLVGLLGGPIAAAVGAGAGYLAGAAFDLTRLGIGQDAVDEVGESLVAGRAALVAHVDEQWQAPVDVRLEAVGGQVLRRSLVDVEDAFFEKELARYEAELDELEAELQTASANRKAELRAKIDTVQRKLDEKKAALAARIEALEREGEAKMASLREQIKTADAERKAHLEKRLSEVKAEYEVRSAKLQQAWELTKSALTV